MSNISGQTSSNDPIIGKNLDELILTSYFDAIVNTIREPLLVLDKGLRVLLANLSFYKTFKVTEEETKNKLIYELGNGQWNIPKLKELLEGILPEKAEFNDYEVEHDFQSVGYRNMLLNARQLFSKGIGQELVLLAIEDITERKNVENMARSLRDELIRSNKELEQFAHIASHDLKEPLRSMYSYADLLEKHYKGKLDKNADDYINFIISGARDMEKLINDLLEYTRIGYEQQLFAKTDCNKLLEIVLRNLKVLISESNAKIIYNSLPEIMACENQLSILFQNLIRNAIKFNKNRNPKINISCEQVGNDWQFSIKDNGIGIAKDARERIFQIFQRLHTQEEYEGTGIGLAICKKIVDLHNGKIWVESEEGEGSTFYFTIPYKYMKGVKPLFLFERS